MGEIQILEQIEHNRIMSIYDSWESEDGKLLVFITEIMSSGTLKDFLAKAKKIKLRSIKKWCKQILEGLDYLHKVKPYPIIHRDLKCDNIFMNGNRSEVKIGDLGLSISMKDKNFAVTVIGTPEFMAPELYDEQYTEKIDIYAFGMCVLEMVTGEYPYSECDNPAQVFKRVSQGIKPRALNFIKDDLTKEFINLCISKVTERPSAEMLLNHPFFTSSRNDDITLYFGDFDEEGEEQRLNQEEDKNISKKNRDSYVSHVSHTSQLSQVKKSIDSISNSVKEIQEKKNSILSKISSSKSTENEEYPRVLIEEITLTTITMNVFLNLGGSYKQIRFPYNRNVDTPDAVAAEMAHNLNLPQLYQENIAIAISNTLKRVETGDYLSDDLHPSQEIVFDEDTYSDKSNDSEDHIVKTVIPRSQSIELKILDLDSSFPQEIITNQLSQQTLAKVQSDLITPKPVFSNSNSSSSLHNSISSNANSTLSIQPSLIGQIPRDSNFSSPTSSSYGINSIVNSNRLSTPYELSIISLNLSIHSVNLQFLSNEAFSFIQSNQIVAIQNINKENLEIIRRIQNKTIPFITNELNGNNFILMIDSSFFNNVEFIYRKTSVDTRFIEVNCKRGDSVYHFFNANFSNIEKQAIYLQNFLIFIDSIIKEGSSQDKYFLMGDFYGFEDISTLQTNNSSPNNSIASPTSFLSPISNLSSGSQFSNIPKIIIEYGWECISENAFGNAIFQFNRSENITFKGTQAFDLLGTKALSVYVTLNQAPVYKGEPILSESISTVISNIELNNMFDEGIQRTSPTKEISTVNSSQTLSNPQYSLASSNSSQSQDKEISSDSSTDWFLNQLERKYSYFKQGLNFIEHVYKKQIADSYSYLIQKREINTIDIFNQFQHDMKVLGYTFDSTKANELYNESKELKNLLDIDVPLSLYGDYLLSNIDNINEVKINRTSKNPNIENKNFIKEQSNNTNEQSNENSDPFHALVLLAKSK